MTLKEQIELIHAIQYQLICGGSVKSACRAFSTSASPLFLDWYRAMCREKEPPWVSENQTRMILALLEAGWRGESIEERLEEVLEEVTDRYRVHMGIKLRLLPVLINLPVVLLMFPAYLILLLGPTLTSLLRFLN